MNLPYRPELKERARELRNQSTIAEVLLWRHIKGRRCRGVDFHRQRPIGDYIVDFFAPELCLAIEIDGDSHRFKATDDARRQETLERLGVRFLRFGHTDVTENPATVAEKIGEWIDAERRKSETLRG